MNARQEQLILAAAMSFRRIAVALRRMYGRSHDGAQHAYSEAIRRIEFVRQARAARGAK